MKCCDNDDDDDYYDQDDADNDYCHADSYWPLTSG